MKNQMKIIMMSLCLYSSMALSFTKTVLVPESVKAQGIHTWTDRFDITHPCDRIQTEFLKAIASGDIMNSDDRNFYVDCMKSNEKYRKGSKSTPTYNPLMQAAIKGKLSDVQAAIVIHMFRDGGIDIHAQDEHSDQKTVLEKAWHVNNFSFAKAAIEAGANSQSVLDDYKKIKK